MCRLLSARRDDLDFFARSHMHFAYMFSRLFDFKPLVDRSNGFETSEFAPDVADTQASLQRDTGSLRINYLRVRTTGWTLAKTRTYARTHSRLQEGYSRTQFYPMLIKPKDMVEVLRAHADAAPLLDNTLVLIELACWMKLTGRFKKSETINLQLQ